MLYHNHTPPPHTELRTQNHNKQMDVHFEDFRANQHTVEVGADDTVEDLRRKVASAMGLPEDSFCMSFGDEAMGEGADMTQLSAGDTIILTKKSKKQEAIAALHALGERDLTPQRLSTVRDHEVARLLLQAEVATVIPDSFLRKTVSWLKHLDLSAVSIVTQIGDCFLEGCTSLASIDLSGLCNVTAIGSCFLSGCEGLTTLDLTPFSGVTSIESFFLDGCNSLTILDLSPLNMVESVGSDFVGNYASLKSIYLSGCSSAVSNTVRESEELRHLVIEARPKRSRDESSEQAHKRQRHTQ